MSQILQDANEMTARGWQDYKNITMGERGMCSEINVFFTDLLKQGNRTANAVNTASKSREDQNRIVWVCR